MIGRYYRAILLAIFVGVFAWLAVAPNDRADWALENVLAVLFVVLLGLSWRRFPLSRVSYTLIVLFLILHEFGAHYTYSNVPYDAWCRQWLGFSLDQALGWRRNNFDRVVHFAYGLLLTYPIREFYFRVADTRGVWGYLFPLQLVMATSMLYELFEWGAAEWFGGDLGMAYLGTQGDVWDAQKDMALAGLGALIAMLITLGINLAIQRDFHREWRRSLDVKHPAPLGEEALRRRLSGR